MGAKNAEIVRELFHFSNRTDVDVWAVPYDTHDWSKEDTAETCWFYTKRTYAFQIAKDLLVPERVRGYEYIWWLNDDVAPRNVIFFPFDSIYKRLKSNTYDIVQFSGFTHSQNFYLNTTKWAPYSFIPVHSVEITAPVILSRTWAACVWPKIRTNEASGWGVDMYVFPHCASSIAYLKLPWTVELIHHDKQTMPKKFQHFNNDYSIWSTPKKIDKKTEANSFVFKKEIRFVHIPKCAGTTAVRALEHHGIVVQGNDFVHRQDAFLSERCAPPWMRRGMYTALVIRDPIEHVYSQYLMCRYSGHGERVGFRRSALYHQITNQTKIAGFDIWINAYLKDHTLNTGCYNPYNLQTRALVCTRTEVMGSYQYFPVDSNSLQAAKEMLLSRNTIVGFANDLPSFVCRVLCTVGSMQQCCTSSSLGVDSETHHLPSHSVDGISQSTLTKVKSLVSYDINLFAYAKQVIQ